MDVPIHIRTFNDVIHRQAVCLKFREIFCNFLTKLAQSILQWKEIYFYVILFKYFEQKLNQFLSLKQNIASSII